MKKTVFDGKQWIFELISQSQVKAMVSGSIYKDKRPTGSTKEDVVINSISMDNSFLQDGVFNVNFYVPMLSVSIAGSTQYMPNNNRMAEISKAASQALDNVFKPEYNLTIVNHNTFEVEAENAIYINFRINLKAYN
ncbi:hypothetical protein FY557_17500 [Chryseobacterium sp. SN22]|uniref:hypothetical protein n=1 Tax=Chryseobacterium sp. SN22 TaxID=2606431 RepID=UPI0011EDAA6F|nr:hypothetical protein [Chryseobacterium sp. SN22]KAA0126446.1 hypothetical protein FY557_17500 [Chryseobacterium sp. SN22]